MLDRECVYVPSPGYLVAKVRTHDFLYDFEYALNVATSLWVPAGQRHSFRNIGDTTAVVIGFCVSRGRTYGLTDPNGLPSRRARRDNKGVRDVMELER